MLFTFSPSISLLLPLIYISSQSSCGLKYICINFRIPAFAPPSLLCLWPLLILSNVWDLRNCGWSFSPVVLRRSLPQLCILSWRLWLKVYNHDNDSMPWIYKDFSVYKGHPPSLSLRMTRLEPIQGNTGPPPTSPRPPPRQLGDSRRMYWMCRTQYFPKFPGEEQHLGTC